MKDSITPPDIQELIKQSFEALLADVSSGKSERFLAYLAFSARFHQYSSDNRMLIYGQFPTATRVAGYNKWKLEGYQVAKGAKAIRIKAPWLRKKADDPEEKELIGYLGVSVFDVSQLTEDKRPPQFFSQVYGDFDGLYTAMVQAAREGGIQVYETQQTFGAQGYSTGGTIVVKEGLTSGNRCLVLLHEWGHEIIHNAQLRKELASQVKECHAEATSYIVGTYFGIPTPYSSDYLINWGNTAESLRSEMDIVQSAASHIIARINAVVSVENDTDNHLKEQQEDKPLTQ